MSIVYSENFNALLAAWFPTSGILATADLWGYQGTKCLACTSVGSLARQTVAPVIPNEGAVRFQAAAIIDPALVAGMYVGAILDWQHVVISHPDAFNLLYNFQLDGAFAIRYSLNGFLTGTATSSTGLFPVDGRPFALQIRFFIGPTNTVTFTVNDVDVWTHSWVNTYVASQWDSVQFQGTRSGLNGALTQVGTIDNLELDNSAAMVSWPVGSAPQLNLTRTCFLPPLPSPTPTGIVIDCVTKRITITGTNFPAVPTVELQGPLGGLMAFTIVSATPTTIILDVPTFTVNGTYCVTVT